MHVFWFERWYFLVRALVLDEVVDVDAGIPPVLGRVVGLDHDAGGPRNF
jgi:hypothetical protein